MNLDCKLFGARNYVQYKRCFLYFKYRCRLLSSMECDLCTQLGWMDSSRPFWNTWKMLFSGLGHWKSVSSHLICISFVSPNNVPLSSFHLLWSCFFLHSLPIFGLQRFPKCKGKKLKSCFVSSSIPSLSNVSEYFQLFCISHAPHFHCNCDELDDLVLLKMSYVG